MSDRTSRHDELKASVSLAVAGALSPSEERSLRTHVGECRTCAAELEALGALARNLRDIPTPMPSAELTERVRRVVHLELAGRADEWLSTLVLVFLLLFSWTITWLSLLIVRLLSGGRIELLSLLSGANMGWSAGYLATAWLGGAAAVVALGIRYRKTRRFA